MTKRLKDVDFAGMITAVLRDVRDTYPIDQLWLERDSKRIHQAFRYRGTQFFTTCLPDLGTILLDGLENGRLDVPNDLPFGAFRSRRIHVPRLFSSLWLRVFTEIGLLREDADPTAVSFLMTLCFMTKKLELRCTPRTLKEAYDEYFDIDSELRPEPLVWRDNPSECGHRNLGSLSDYQDRDQPGGLPLSSGEDRGIGALLSSCQRTADRLSAALGFIQSRDLAGRHGPGAVADLPFRGEKYLFPRWPHRLEAYFPFDHHGVLNSSVIDEENHLRSQPHSDEYPDEPCSVLLHVPKTKSAPRLIAKEPTSHQWCQQAVASELRRRVERSPLGMCIDFFDQSPSQVAALNASKDRSRATIDLSSASDRLSCFLVQRMFRGNVSLLHLLISTRTRYLTVSHTGPYAKLVLLRKFASMGSALTFPVQSVVFSMLAVGVGAIHHPRASLSALCGMVRVFGDDIVVPHDWVDDLIAVLTAVGLRVNVHKSFWKGSFRESCGVYAFRGYDVTPFRVRHARVADPTSTWSMVCTANNAFSKGYWRTSQWIERQLLSGINLPATDRRCSPFGLLTNSKGIDPAAKVRWNRDLQRKEVQVSSVFAKEPATKDPVGTIAYSYLINSIDGYDPLSHLQEARGIRPLVYAEGERSRPAKTRRIWVDVGLLTA